MRFRSYSNIFFESEGNELRACMTRIRRRRENTLNPNIITKKKRLILNKYNIIKSSKGYVLSLRLALLYLTSYQLSLQ
jgi:hypothetical protein